MNAAIIQIHKDLEQAAQVSGVPLFRTLIFITLPLLFPAFVAGWIWVAVHSLRAFAIPLMLAGAQQPGLRRPALGVLGKIDAGGLRHGRAADPRPDPADAPAAAVHFRTQPAAIGAVG